MKPRVWLPALLLATAPVVALWGHNVGEVAAHEVWRALLVALTGALVLLAILGLLLRDGHKAALISAGAIILFFSYGHIYDLVKTWELASVPIGRHRYLLPLSAAVFLLGSAWVVRTRRPLGAALSFLLVTGLALLLLPAGSLLSYQVAAARSPRPSLAEVPEPAPPSSPGGAALPDIYYIILDGYARQDVLERLYAYDNSEFTGYLIQHGFYVADQSHSNYNKTLLSLASSLNMGYVNDLTGRMGERSRNNAPLAELIQHSQVRSFLQSQGYSLVAFRTGFGPTTIQDADRLIDTGVGDTTFLAMNSFEGLLLESTLLRAAMDSPFSRTASALRRQNQAHYDTHRDRIRRTLGQLGQTPPAEGPSFVFAHIIAPHPPFVFGAQGEARYPPYAYTLQDGSRYPGSQEAYIREYRDQLIYINQLVEQAIERILENSGGPPVIILQADHGPGAYLNWGSLDRTDLRERLAIINAYYLPDGAQLYPSISPVNTFRVVLNQLFQADLSLLPDDSYFADQILPYRFIRVTDQILTEEARETP